MSPTPRPAYVESIDESSGRTVKGSRRSAKEKKLRSDKPKRTPQINHLPPAPTTPKDRPVREKNVPVVTEREVKHERRNSTSTSSSSPVSPRKHYRPPPAHENNHSYHQAERKTREDPSHFGRVQSVARPAPVTSQSMQNTLVQQPHPARPRAISSSTYQRPVSFHGTYNGPPLSNSAWANYQPNPAYNYSSSPNYPQQPQYPQLAAPTPPPVPDYFGSQPLPERSMSTRPLSHRFDTPARTASGFGMRELLPLEFNAPYDTGYHDDGYASSNHGAVVKRNSIREPSSRLQRMSRDYHDSQTYHDPQPYYEPQPYHDPQAMRPPPRPILRHRALTEHATSAEYPPHDSYRDDQDDQSEERTIIREPSRQRRAGTHRRHSMVTYALPDHHDRDEDHERVRPRNRRSDAPRRSESSDMDDDLAQLNIERPNKGRRRASVYGASTTHSEHRPSPPAPKPPSGYEAKIRQATNYQEEVVGPTIPLTAEILKKQEKQRRKDGSSQSTKSSHSRDESDYKKSVTTRTTRSGSGENEENLTIKLKGTTRLTVGGAQIECDGGEIEIKRQGGGGMRNGSERSVSEFGAPMRGQQQIDDRRSRVNQQQIEDRKSRVGHEDRRSRFDEPIEDRQSRFDESFEDRRSRVDHQQIEDRKSRVGYEDRRSRFDEPIEDRRSRFDESFEDQRSRVDHQQFEDRRSRVGHEDRRSQFDEPFEDPRSRVDDHHQFDDRRSRVDHRQFDDRRSRYDHPTSRPRQRESSPPYTRSVKNNGGGYF